MSSQDAVRKCRQALSHAHMHAFSAVGHAIAEDHQEKAADLARLADAINAVRKDLHLLTVRNANRKYRTQQPMDPPAVEHRDNLN